MSSIAELVDAPFPIALKHGAYHFVNWARTVDVTGLMLCEPQDAHEVVEVVNWAAANGKRVRVIGHQHNWSPLTVSPGHDGAGVRDVVLMHLGRMGPNLQVQERDPRAGGRPTASVNMGVSQGQFLELLEKVPRRASGGPASAPGFGLAHCPAPDSITLGGMMAIDGHGTAVPCANDKEFLGDAPIYGTYSNRVVSITVVAYNAATERYELRTIGRDEDGGRAIAPFLTHCGRTIVTRATLQVEPNYYMRCRSFMGIDWRTMFAAPGPDGAPKEKSMAWFLERHGRAEAIWYPFTEKPWLKVWTVTGPQRPANSRLVTECCNYPFTDNIVTAATWGLKLLTDSSWDTAFIPVNVIKEIGWLLKLSDPASWIPLPKAVRRRFAINVVQTPTTPDPTMTGAAEQVAARDAASAPGPVFDYEKEEGAPLDGADPSQFSTWGLIRGFTSIMAGFLQGNLTKFLSQTIYNVTVNGLRHGTSHNDHQQSYDIWGPSKNTLVYLGDETMRVTANGYAIMCRPSHVATVMYEFTTKFHEMLLAYEERGMYPISMPLEVRVTGVDDPTLVGKGEGQSPWLSAMHQTEDDRNNGFTHCVWLDVLSLPGNPWANKFYNEMERWMLGSTIFNGEDARMRPEWSKGWGYDAKLGPWADQIMLDHTRNSLPRWDDAMRTLNAADKHKLYTNRWMSNFFQETSVPLNTVAIAAA